MDKTAKTVAVLFACVVVAGIVAWNIPDDAWPPSEQREVHVGKMALSLASAERAFLHAGISIQRGELEEGMEQTREGCVQLFLASRHAGPSHKPILRTAWESCQQGKLAMRLNRLDSADNHFRAMHAKLAELPPT